MTEFLKRLNKADIRNILAVLYCTGAIVFIYVLVFKPVPMSNKDLINVIGGNVLAGISIILGYYFGASKGESKSETE